jgi:hypothetical protein
VSASAPARRWTCRALGLITVAVFLVLVARFWHPVYGFTSFIQLDSSNDQVKIAAFREHPVYVYRDTGGYDGLYYAQIAYHPLLDSPELAPAIDNLSYRARRILPSALAWTLAAGNPAGIVHVYSLLNVAAWLGLALILWHLLAVNSARGWLAWAGVLFSAGVLSSVRLALTDLIALTILAGALLAAERQRRGWAIGALALSGLARETSLVALAGLVERPWWSWRNLGRAILAVAPLAMWVLYVNWRVSGTAGGLYNFSWPGSGYIWKWRSIVAAWPHEPERLLVWTTVLATLGLTTQAAFFLFHRQPGDRWWRVGLGYTALLLCLGQPVWDGFPGAATRVLLPLNLAFNVLAHRTRASLGWLLVGNLTVFAGLLALGSVPHGHRELAAVRSGGTACVARLDQGWYSVESSWRHTWAWSDATSRLELITWGQRSQPVVFEFFLRSLTPRTLSIRDDQGEIWHGTVGPQKMKVTVNSRLVSGHGRLEFSSPEPAAVELPERGGRSLAFALYDARLLLPEP